ncbi:MAG: AEC family transporter [Patescibacteria group bacterium]|nr:AEC family transporter [Patescibacteria group bacterium]
MALFFSILGKIFPLYLIILLGFLAGKKLRARKETVAALLIYIIAPMVVFNGVITVKLTPGLLLLPLLFFILCTSISLLFYTIGKRLWQDPTKNILAFAAGSGNTGYFGLPVALAIFKFDPVGIVVIAVLGLILFENTVGFYITARGHHTPKEALWRVLKLPTVYAFLLAVVLNLSKIHLGQAYGDLALAFRGAYSVLGLMIIGLGIADLQSWELDAKFLSLTFLSKFLVWPVLMGLIIMADHRFWHWYNPQVYQVLLLLAAVPLAANTVAYAAELKTHPDKAATAVFFSTVFALFYIPLVAFIFFR